jgi:hypothetical protein
MTKKKKFLCIDEVEIEDNGNIIASSLIKFKNQAQW